MNNLWDIEILKNGLAEFGLCPDDWNVSKENGLFYKIENIDEPHFFFKGYIKLENGYTKWDTIRLAGL